ncbi:hypothetical protein B5K06_31930 [Rhizobium grahamii]|uniref:Uncharacterized protein n=2 Tax=Rhizobium grahamii TaxID=1120045 RepID=S3HC35_9HYPH|nr:hypothetical protein RGCCGE502_21995 [Rhizobium grahamii CCGE 502]RDJ02696.1 hypothetical protein B5K06_31930 [Rhizobium grahamii]
MPRVSYALNIVDDFQPLFEALSEWCREQKINADSLAGSAAASRLFDFVDQGCSSKTQLLEAMRSELSH